MAVVRTETPFSWRNGHDEVVWVLHPVAVFEYRSRPGEMSDPCLCSFRVGSKTFLFDKTLSSTKLLMNFEGPNFFPCYCFFSVIDAEQVVATIDRFPKFEFDFRRKQFSSTMPLSCLSSHNMHDKLHLPLPKGILRPAVCVTRCNSAQIFTCSQAVIGIVLQIVWFALVETINFYSCFGLCRYFSLSYVVFLLPDVGLCCDINPEQRVDWIWNMLSASGLSV